MLLISDLQQALDPARFALQSLNFDPDTWQEKTLQWNGKRLLLNCSRQSGKSTTAAALALHRAIYYPGSLILLISPSLRQSGELFRKMLEHLARMKIQPKRTEANKLSTAFDNGSRIVSLPSGEATVRGFSGADLIIEDEAARVSDELYFAIRPMLAVSGGKLVLMSTPFGKRGHFFQEWTEGGQGWERIEIPATECPRISPEFLEEERRALGDWWFTQEYMCKFVETTDQLFSHELVMRAVTAEIEPLFGGGFNG